MAILIGIAAIVVLVLLLLVLGPSISAAVATDRQRGRDEQARQRRQWLAAAERERRQRLLSRRLQLALLQLPRSPDFRRAAAAAMQARELPNAFRQRQFLRFRAALVEHFLRGLEAGHHGSVLAVSLGQLVQALGMAAYEADYIRLEAERSRSLSHRRTSYAERLNHAQRQHADRVAALRETPGIDGDTREQLVEAEQSRFREELARLGEEAPA